METRPDSIYVSRTVRRALTYVPRTEEGQTSDGIADQVLLAWLAANHPAILAHIRSQDEQDKEFRDRIKQGQV